MSRTAAIFDLDSTLVGIDTYPAFLLTVLLSRTSRWIPAIFWLPLALSLHLIGLRDNSWLKQTFLKTICGGLDDDELARSVEPFVSGLMEKHLRPGAVDALRRHREEGHRMLLATASPDLYVRPLAEQLGLEIAASTKTERDTSGRLTGRLDGGNCHGAEKLRRIEALFGPDRNEWTITAYSDHESDLPLLEWADTGSAVNPTRSLRSKAEAAGISVLDWSR